MTDKTNKIIIYTDGGSRGNPGPAAIGVVICDSFGKSDKAYAEHIGTATNNEAEYGAVIFALKKAKHLLGSSQAKATHVKVRSDSQLLVNQLNAKYKIHEERMKLLFVDVWNAMQDFASVVFVHIPREQNIEADRVLNQKLDEAEKKGTLF